MIAQCAGREKIIRRRRRLPAAACLLILAGRAGFPALRAQEERAAQPAAAATPAALLLRPAGFIALPGPKGKRFDYLSLDGERNLLFATHLGAGLLYVIDLRTNTVRKTIPGLPGIEGVEIAADAGKVYASDWFENRIAVIDLARLTLIKKLPTGAKPDGIAYAPPFHKLFVSDERAQAVAVLDTGRDELITTLHFSSETGNPRYDPVSRRLFVNLSDLNRIAEIDPETDRVVAEYPVAGCIGNHGMALDSAHRLAFLSCEGNDRMTVFSLATHAVVADFPQAAGGDVIAFDPGLRRIYVACYSGAISVFQEDDPAHFRKLGDAPVQKKVHSLAIDPRTHRIYAPEQEADGAPAARIAIYDAAPPRD